MEEYGMTVSVRYLVHDVDQAIRFYIDLLGFELLMRPAPHFSALKRGELRLLFNKPGGGGGGGQAMPDARNPAPGGWNRFQIEVDDLAARVAELKAKGASFRRDIVGSQILVDDPSGNPVELFEPKHGS
jgi:catechol 2,3-dioxygenase-like lactoylglutathione lyase family enzyme